MKISHHKALTYSKCGEEYARKYVDYNWSPPNDKLLLGRLGHGFIETWLKFGQNLKAEQEMIDGQEWAKAELTLPKQELIDKAQMMAVKLFPELPEPLEIEKRFEFELTPDLILNGAIDLISKTHVIHDYKFTSKSWGEAGQSKADSMTQFNTYCIWAMEEYGLEQIECIVDVVIYYPVNKRRKEPEIKIEQHKTTRTKKEVDRFKRHLIDIGNKILKGEYHLPVLDGFLSPCGSCDVKDCDKTFTKK
jgi:hypothetical protein